MNKLGKFEIRSGKVLVSDPCYDLDTYGEIDNVRKGEWVAEVSLKECFGMRVSRLYAHHVSFPCDNPFYEEWKEEPITVGVDSGQAGIFDVDYFKNQDVAKDYEYLNPDEIINKGEDDWYSMCCDQTLHTECDAGVIPFGVVSSSGCGDGSYSCFSIKKNGEVVAIMIDFGLENDESDEDDEVQYITCEYCETEFHIDNVTSGNLCPDCRMTTSLCAECHRRYDNDDLENGVCEDCRNE